MLPRESSESPWWSPGPALPILTRQTPLSIRLHTFGFVAFPECLQLFESFGAKLISVVLLPHDTIEGGIQKGKMLTQKTCADIYITSRLSFVDIVNQQILEET